MAGWISSEKTTGYIITLGCSYTSAMKSNSDAMRFANE